MRVDVEKKNPALESLFTDPEQTIFLDANFFIPPDRSRMGTKPIPFLKFCEIWLDPIFDAFPNLAIHESVYHELVADAVKKYADERQSESPYPLRQRSYLSLSGGEKQRVILARAIVQQPELLILDEPTNHLDIKFQFEVLDLVKDLNISTLCVLHNIELSARYCDYLYAMKQGRIMAEGAPNKLITKETIRTIYDVESEIYTNPITQDLAVAFLPTRRK